MSIFIHDNRTQEIAKAIGVLFTATTGRVYCTSNITRDPNALFITISSLNNSADSFEEALAEASPQISLRVLEKERWGDDCTPIQVEIPLNVDIDKLKEVGQKQETKRINKFIAGEMRDFETGLTNFERVVASYSVGQAIDSDVRGQFGKLCERMMKLSAKLGGEEITREQVAGIKERISNRPQVT